MQTDITDAEHVCLDLLRDHPLMAFRPHTVMIKNLVRRGLVEITIDTDHDWAGLTDEGKFLLRFYGKTDAY